jgi:hypothetical protein
MGRLGSRHDLPAVPTAEPATGAYRIQASAGPVTDKALEEIIFRAEHGVLQSLAPYPRAQRVALLTTFLEEVARPDSTTL